MLELAQTKPHGIRVRYAMGRGEDLPLRSRSIDLVFLSMVIQPLQTPAQVAHECGRVLAKRIRFFFAREARTGSSYPLRPFFPAAVPIMERILPTGPIYSKCF